MNPNYPKKQEKKQNFKATSRTLDYASLLRAEPTFNTSQVMIKDERREREIANDRNRFKFEFQILIEINLLLQVRGILLGCCCCCNSSYYLKVDKMFVLVPVVNLEDDHLPGGNGHSLVGVTVDHVHMLVAIGGQDLVRNRKRERDTFYYFIVVGGTVSLCV